MDIVPHHELVEGEVPQHRRLFEVPAFVFHYASPDDAEHLAQVHAFAVLRKRVESRNLHLEELAQHLLQGDVEHRVLVTASDVVAAHCAPSCDLDRDQQQRRVAWSFRIVRLVPFQCTESQEEGVGSVLLHCRPGVAVEGGQSALELRLWKEGPEPLVAQVGADRGVVEIARDQRTVAGVVRAFSPGRNSADVQRLLAGEQVFDLVKAHGHYLDIAASARDAEQVVLHAQVQQLALPDGLLVHRRPGERVNLPWLAADARRRAGLSQDGVFPVRVDGPVFHKRQRTDVFLAAFFDVQEKSEVLGVVVDVRLSLDDGFVERQSVAFRHSCGLHKQHFVDARREAFRQKGAVVVDAVGEGAVDQPASRVSVRAVHNQQRMHSCGLEAACVEQSDVEAGGEPVTEYPAGQPDPLSAVLEACRRVAVGYSLLGEGFVDGSHLELHPFRPA